MFIIYTCVYTYIYIYTHIIIVYTHTHTHYTCIHLPSALPLYPPLAAPPVTFHLHLSLTAVDICIGVCTVFLSLSTLLSDSIWPVLPHAGSDFRESVGYAADAGRTAAANTRYKRSESSKAQSSLSFSLSLSLCVPLAGARGALAGARCACALARPRSRVHTTM